jgi:hypothetical protein
MSETTYNVIAPESGVPVKAWTKGVPLADAARLQLLNAAQLRSSSSGSPQCRMSIGESARPLEV